MVPFFLVLSLLDVSCGAGEGSIHAAVLGIAVTHVDFGNFWFLHSFVHIKLLVLTSKYNKTASALSVHFCH